MSLATAPSASTSLPSSPETPTAAGCAAAPANRSFICAASAHAASSGSTRGTCAHCATWLSQACGLPFWRSLWRMNDPRRLAARLADPDPRCRRPAPAAVPNPGEIHG